MEELKNKNRKKEKGITLIALVITIVALIILSSIVINIGTNSITESKEDILLSELGMIQNAVLQRKTKADITKETYPGQIITTAGINLEEVISEINANKASEEESVTRKDTNDAHYYVLSTTNGGLKDLGITNSEDAYIVNYGTGEVINYTTKLTKTGKPLYIYAKEANK
mgnify:CR=1 FL=1